MAVNQKDPGFDIFRVAIFFLPESRCGAKKHRGSDSPIILRPAAGTGTGVLVRKAGGGKQAASGASAGLGVLAG